MADETVLTRVIAGRYEDISSVLDRLAELSYNNSGGKYSEEISDSALEQLKKLQTLGFDPYAKAVIFSHYGVEIEIVGNRLSAWIKRVEAKKS